MRMLYHNLHDFMSALKYHLQGRLEISRPCTFPCWRACSMPSAQEGLISKESRRRTG